MSARRAHAPHKTRQMCHRRKRARIKCVWIRARRPNKHLARGDDDDANDNYGGVLALAICLLLLSGYVRAVSVKSPLASPPIPPHLAHPSRISAGVFHLAVACSRDAADFGHPRPDRTEKQSNIFINERASTINGRANFFVSTRANSARYLANITRPAAAAQIRRVNGTHYYTNVVLRLCIHVHVRAMRLKNCTPLKRTVAGDWEND